MVFDKNIIHFFRVGLGNPFNFRWRSSSISTSKSGSTWRNFSPADRTRDANLLRILGVRPQDSNPHALHLLITHCTAPIVILGRLCIQIITDPYSYADLSTSKQPQPWDPTQLKDFPFVPCNYYLNVEPRGPKTQNAQFIRACTYTTFKVHWCFYS